jgi:hypothetical protein
LAGHVDVHAVDRHRRPVGGPLDHAPVMHVADLAVGAENAEFMREGRAAAQEGRGLGLNPHAVLGMDERGELPLSRRRSVAPVDREQSCGPFQPVPADEPGIGADARHKIRSGPLDDAGRRSIRHVAKSNGARKF